MARQAPPRGYEGGAAQRNPAEAQEDDDDVPEWTPVEEESEVEAVQPVIQPAVPAAGAIDARHGSEVRIQIQPGLARILVAIVPIIVVHVGELRLALPRALAQIAGKLLAYTDRGHGVQQGLAFVQGVVGEAAGFKNLLACQKRHGIGSKLAEGVFEHLRGNSSRVVAKCPFMAAYASRRPEYAAMLDG